MIEEEESSPPELVEFLNVFSQYLLQVDPEVRAKHDHYLKYPEEENPADFPWAPEKIRELIHERTKAEIVDEEDVGNDAPN